MLLESRKKMVEDRLNANAKFWDMKNAQEARLNKARHLQNQHEALEDEIIQRKADMNQFLSPRPR